jgi:hypothetical protein
MQNTMRECSNQYTGFEKLPVSEPFVYTANFISPGGFPQPINWASSRFSIINQNTLQELAYSTTNIGDTQIGQMWMLVNSKSFLDLTRGTYYYEFILIDNAGNPQTFEMGVLRLI